MKHMTSLRTQYSRCMRSGSAIATTHRQRWLVRKLAFLKPHIKKRLRATGDCDAAVWLASQTSRCQTFRTVSFRKRS